MSEGLLGTILSAVIAGLFGLISKRMDLRRDQEKNTSAGAKTTDITAAIASINYGNVLKHIGILQFIVNVVGFLAGLLLGAAGSSTETIIISLLFIGTVVLSAGFFWAALSVEKVIRWKHLSIVAVGVAITTVIVNSIILQTPLTLLSFAIAFAQSFISMGIGGALANTIKDRG